MDESNGQYSKDQDYTAEYSYQAPVEDGGKNRTNGLQIAGLVCGILAICTSCCYGVPGAVLGIAGLVCAIFGNHKGKTGIGIAALVCSIIGIILSAIVLLYCIWALKYLMDMGYWDQILNAM